MIGRRSALRFLAAAPAAVGAALAVSRASAEAAPAELESHPVAVIPKGEPFTIWQDRVVWADNSGTAPTVEMSSVWPASDGWKFKTVTLPHNTLIRAVRDRRA